jgi:hypothetical protein
MKRTVMVVDDEQNMQAVIRMGELEYSRTDLTSVRASERRDTEVPAGAGRSHPRRAREGWHRATFVEGSVV